MNIPNHSPHEGATFDRLSQDELLLAAADERNLDRVKGRISDRLGHHPHAAAAVDLIDEAILYLRLASSGQ